MNMDHLIGQRFALVSKSEIRYVGTLHQINPEEATIALEDVSSLGTEDRSVKQFVPPSQQKFDFIVFRGSDVKDIKLITEEENSQPEPQQIPNDPAILNSSRAPPPQSGPQDRRESPYPPSYPPQGYPPYPPPQFGRGYGPPPPGNFGPGPGFPGPYGPPPPGYFGHPGPGYPPPQFQGPPQPPPGQQNPSASSQNHSRQAPTSSQPTQELPVDNKDATKQPEPKPSAPQPKQPSAATSAPSAPIAIPTGPKSAIPKGKIAPAMPFQVNQKSFTPPVQPDAPPAAPKQTQSKAQMDEATLKAKEAVQAALAKLPGNAPNKPAPVPTATSVDAVTERMGEMNTSANGTSRGRGAPRGQRGEYRGRAGGQAPRKIEIPKSDYDFETANQKFNKEDLIKEAIASGSPAADDVSGDGLERHDSNPSAGKAYNKSSSFFDNISSEARDREDNVDGRAMARQNRADEFKRNVDTFGQGNVDGGYRGRGRGGYRGRQYGGSRGYRGNRGFGGRGGHANADPGAGSNAPPTAVPTVQS